MKCCLSESAWSLKGIMQNVMRWFPKHYSYGIIFLEKQTRGNWEHSHGYQTSNSYLQSRITFAGKHGNSCRSRQKARYICLASKLREFLSIAKFRSSKAFFTTQKDQIHTLGFNLSSFFFLQRLTNLSTSTFLGEISLVSSLGEKLRAVVFSQKIC